MQDRNSVPARILGGWLGSAITQSRAFAVIADVVMFALGAAAWGLLTTVLIGEGLAPVGALQAILIALLGVLLVVLFVLVEDLIRLLTRAAPVSIDPMPARSNESPQFTVTFLNTTGQVRPYRWFVKI